jgi:hypothetical protein
MLKLQAENNALREENSQFKKLMADAIRIIFHAGTALGPLFQGELAGLEPTTDGTAVQMFNEGITVTVAPFAQEIRIVDGSGTVPVAIYTLTDGRLGKDDQIHMMGLIARIRIAAGGGEDPVSDRLTLTGVVTAGK